MDLRTCRKGRLFDLYSLACDAVVLLTLLLFPETVTTFVGLIFD